MLPTPLNFWTHPPFDEKNGAKGKCPVLPSEFRSLGLDSDLRCFQLVVYLYRRVLDPNRSGRMFII